MNEAPQAWEAFHKRAKRLQGSFSFKGVLPGGEVVSHQKSEIKQAPGCALVLDQYLIAEDGSRSGSLRTLNSHYGFELRRGEPTKEWSVSQLALDSVKRLPFDDLFQEVQMWTNAPIDFFVVSGFMRKENKGFWPTIIKEPGFRLKTAVAQMQNGKQWSKVEFQYQPNGKNQRVPSIITGWVLLDPQRHWSIQEYDIQLEWAHQAGVKVTYAARCQYEESRDSFPVLKRMDISYHNPQKSYKCDFLYEFDFREADVPKEDFTLSAFGFPEPMGMPAVNRGGIRWYIWLGVAALVSVGLAYLWITLKRRYLQAPKPAEAKTDPKEGRT